MILAGRIAKSQAALDVFTNPQLLGPRLAVIAAGRFFELEDETSDALRVALDTGELGYVARSGVLLPRAAKTCATTALYSAPSMNSPLLLALGDQTQLLVFGEAEGWAEAVALGVDGYLPADALAFPVRGRVNAYLNLRVGASTTARVLELLPPGTELNVWHRQDVWLYVADTSRVGYVHGAYVDLTASVGPEPEQGSRTPLRSAVVEVAPTESDRLRLPVPAAPAELQVVELWNRLGGLIRAVSALLDLDPGVAVAVLLVESGGRGFDPAGRMIIRFENHIFYDYWGREHQELYHQHFAFSAAQRWREHGWRPSADAGWQPVHADQAAEWAAFNFAGTLDQEAARLSISMGAPQIMGFNYSALAYPSVDAMFGAFAASEVEQVLGFFEFISGGGTDLRRLALLRADDFEGFARLYNGSGQALHYGSLLRSAYATYRALRGQL